MMRKMHILFVTSEVAGIFKIGGLADVSLSLPLALAKEGVKVTVALPFYKTIDIQGVKGVGELSVDFGGHRHMVFIFAKKMDTHGTTLLLFRHPLLDEYHGSPIEETFAFYSRVISTFYLHGNYMSKYPIDIVHCHDWHTALVPLLIGEQNKLHGKKETIQAQKARTIITIHNLLYQGVVGVDIADRLDAPRELFHTKEDRVSLLREGFEYADIITTVSPTYAKEIVQTSHHDGVGDVLQRRGDRVRGILNGIDPAAWDPKHDRALSYTFDRESVFRVKPQLKESLQKEVGLPQERVPLYGFVGRIEPRQKGIDIVIGALETLLATTPMQVVVLGTGDPKTVRELQQLAKSYKDKLVFVHMFDEKLARRIYAACDVLLVPSKFEPCGLTQMIAMRYGTIPLVRATGGLADSVKDEETGFVFGEYSKEDLIRVIERAQKAWFVDGPAWKELVHRVMREDFSWDRSAMLYKEMYDGLMR
jgi:starch synthase